MKKGIIKGVVTEFKEFATRGNVMDMAVGVIIGAAFNKIVNSFVTDIIMPPLGWMLGRVDFSNIFITLKHGAAYSGHYASLAAAQADGAVTVNIGIFANTIISFLITAVAIFILIKAVNKLKRQPEAAPAAAPTTKDCPFCFTSIDIRAKKCPNCTADLP
ncbi:large conductance mechanosensitive channel [Elusimicrobium posterum]|uniref:large-conductance mechanosensitive channel protein MscL n=1 Tax=Elusimicrobium posterum TaxID=3116653 RepID=UPI003C7409C5